MKNNLMFNNMPGREWVRVPHISSLLGCSQHCRATLFKTLHEYANTQEESKLAGYPEFKNSA